MNYVCIFTMRSKSVISHDLWKNPGHWWETVLFHTNISVYSSISNKYVRLKPYFTQKYISMKPYFTLLYRKETYFTQIYRYETAFHTDMSVRNRTSHNSIGKKTYFTQIYWYETVFHTNMSVWDRISHKYLGMKQFFFHQLIKILYTENYLDSRSEQSLFITWYQY